MENSRGGQNVEKDLEAQERPINANNPSSSEMKTEPEGSTRLPEKKEKESVRSAEAIQAQAQAEEFWRKIYNTMKNVETKEQAESLFKGMSSSKRVHNEPAKIEAHGERQSSEHESRKASELRAREKALAAEGFVDVKVDANTPEMFRDVSKKLHEEAYDPEEELLKKRRKKCLCCTAQRLWCILTLVIPILVVLLVMYFVVFTPKDPSVSIEDVSISTFRFVESDAEAPRIEAAMNFTIRLKNPNRFAEVVYDRLDVLLTYRTTALGGVPVGVVAGYKQQEKNLSSIEGQLPWTTAPIKDAADSERLRSEVANGNVRVELRGNAEGHFKVSKLKLGSFNAPVDCKLNVQPETTTGKALLLSASCYNRPS